MGPWRDLQSTGKRKVPWVMTELQIKQRTWGLPGPLPSQPRPQEVPQHLLQALQLEASGWTGPLCVGRWGGGVGRGGETRTIQVLTPRTKSPAGG